MVEKYKNTIKVSTVYKCGDVDYPPQSGEGAFQSFIDRGDEEGIWLDMCMLPISKYHGCGLDMCTPLQNYLNDSISRREIYLHWNDFNVDTIKADIWYWHIDSLSGVIIDKVWYNDSLVGKYDGSSGLGIFVQHIKINRDIDDPNIP